MITNWQIAAVEYAARRFPVSGISKDDRDIWISMRNEGVIRLPVGEQGPEGYIKINILGKIQLPKKPLVEAIMNMDDENYKFNYNGYHCYHIDQRRFEREHIIELGTPCFLQSGNSFPPEVERYMVTISCMEFVDRDELYEIGGGVPATSEISDAREEALEVGENPDDWENGMMQMAEENIRSCLKTIIIFDDEIVDGNCIDAVLVDFKG